MSGFRGVVGVAAVGLTLLGSVFSPSPAYAKHYKDPSSVFDLSGRWLFREGDSPTFARPSLDDFAWSSRRVPTLFNPFPDRTLGHGWYRFHFTAGKKVRAANLVLMLGTAREAVGVYINGSLIAERGQFGAVRLGGARNLPLSAMIPAGTLKTGDNVLAVRTYDPSFGGGIPVGPVLLGLPGAINSIVDQRTHQVVSLRFALGLLVLFLGLGQWWIHRETGGESENRWLVGTSITTALFMFSGMGVGEPYLPIDALPRVPIVCAALVVLTLGKYFAGRYADAGNRSVLVGQRILEIVAIKAVAASLR